MKGIKSFIAGFSLSLISAAFAGQLYTPLQPQKKYAARNITIDLFKKSSMPIASADNPPLIKGIAKHSLINTAEIETIGAIPQLSDDTDNINGAEDDEILSVNVDDIIPIDFISPKSNRQAEISGTEEESLSAMLPNDVNYDDTAFDDNDPWDIAKGGKYVKNKKLLEDIGEQTVAGISIDNLRVDINGDKEISYKVAEKIKQSIIFPIPDEILNDEELTPTFIKGHKDTSAPQKKEAAKPQIIHKSTPKRESSMTIIEKAPTTEIAKDETNSKGLLNSISSWFAPATDNSEKKSQTKTVPSYSSQSSNLQKTNETQLKTNNEFASFYETLQETTKSHQRNKILPSELKLNFQPGRAEISGQTLRWLKAFSETASADNTYLQVRLDAATPADIQRKRLNLLYSIFINNGVSPKKIDTVFAPTEPNAFVIRSLTYD